MTAFVVMIPKTYITWGLDTLWSPWTLHARFEGNLKEGKQLFMGPPFGF